MTLPYRFGYIRDEKTWTVSTSHNKIKKSTIIAELVNICNGVCMYISAIENTHRMGGM